MDELIIEDEYEHAREPGDLEERVRIAAAWLRDRVDEHPFAALGIAVMAGYVVGRLIGRR